MDDKLALYRDAVYRIVKTNIVNKVSFVGFRGGDRPNRPHGSALISLTLLHPKNLLLMWIQRNLHQQSHQASYGRIHLFSPVQPSCSVFIAFFFF